uniref:hypothetical protein n=1 Tax=Hypnea pseudomusciformis TaxID=1545697 RepID=UPI0027DAA800|nr:hypothetical protein P4C74_pgp182 [Hypnea pseudomusciformis]WCH55051.1 hypothetical protein [Hypnea pseudomusciformis]WCH56644.1 hypothetical protein [Hypnea pseudomusciformis]
MSQKLNSNLEVSKQINKLELNNSLKQQLSLMQEIFSRGLIGQEALLDLLIRRRILTNVNISCLDGALFQILYSSKFHIIQQGLRNYFPNGLIELEPSFDLDYKNLQVLLQNYRYQDADRLTQKKLCKLVGLDDHNKRDWLYFTDIPMIPSDDLLMIDLLWRVYSREKFGFSKQRQIWLANNCNWNRLWQNIGWTYNSQPLRYPNEFNWTLSAPSGHLPLFNQLRGVQVLSALFHHAAWMN